MRNRTRSALLLAIATCSMPGLLLHAQQPPAPANVPAQPPATEPSAKEVSKEAAKPEPARPPTDPIERIKEEGLKRSQVMATLSYLTDVIGPRLTGSPNLKRANEWTRDGWPGGAWQNAHLEPWGPFGRGWTLKRFSAQVVEPQCIPLIAYPKAWSPGDRRAARRRGRLLRRAKTEADFAKFKGKLKGAIVLLEPARARSRARFEPLATRLTDKELLDLADAAEPSRPTRPGPPAGSTASARQRPHGRSARLARPPGPGRPRPVSRPSSGPWPSWQRQEDDQFLIEEGAAVIVDPSTRATAARCSWPGERARPARSRASGRGRPGGSRPGTRTRPGSCPRSSSPRSTTTGWSG